MGHADKPIVLGMVDNLMLSTRIENAVDQLGYQMIWIGSDDQLGPQLATEEAPQRQFAEHVEGRGAELLDRITRMHPVLIIFDMGNERVQWERWLALVKSVPATRRIPAIAFGPHVDTAAFESAKERGAEAVYPRSRFMRQTERILKEHAVLTDFEAIRNSCQAPLSELAIKGFRLFNQGEYFEAHEELELAWIEDESPGRELYRGVLQIAVAYLQIQRKNYRGAYKMFLRARQWLDPLPDVCRGVDVKKLRLDAAAVREKILSLGPEHIDTFDQDLFKKLHYSIDHSSE